MPMKSSKIILTIILLTLTLTSSIKVMARNDEEFKGTTNKKNIFTFKTDRELVGAQVEVFYSNGELLTTHKLLKKKMVIDFGEGRLGTYTIRLTKGNSAKEYHFIKK